MPFRGVRFVRGRTVAQAEFRGGQALGVRRTVLHRVLVEHAKQLRVDLRWGSRGVRYTHSGIAAGNELIQPRLLTVGADGQKSAVREAAGLHSQRSPNTPLRFPPPLFDCSLDSICGGSLGRALPNLCDACFFP